MHICNGTCVGRAGLLGGEDMFLSHDETPVRWRVGLLVGSIALDLAQTQLKNLACQQDKDLMIVKWGGDEFLTNVDIIFRTGFYPCRMNRLGEIFTLADGHLSIQSMNTRGSRRGVGVTQVIDTAIQGSRKQKLTSVAGLFLRPL